MTVIGIDPAFRKKGFAMCIIDETGDIGFKVFKTFLDFVKWAFSEDVPAGKVNVVIENANLQNITFDMSGSKGEIAKRSRNVGACQAISQATFELCQYVFGKDCTFEVSPREKGKKWTPAEANNIATEKGLNYTFKNSEAEQDKIDAFKLCLLLPYIKAAKNNYGNKHHIQ